MRTVRTRRGFLQEYPGTRTQTPSSSPDPFSCYEMQPGLNKKLHVCPTICLTSGVHAKTCALFCAPSVSQTIASGHTRAGPLDGGKYFAIERRSRRSHSVSVISGRSLNQRVPGSSPGRLTTPLLTSFLIVSYSDLLRSLRLS